MLLIYTPTITNRIRYTFDLFFNNILKVDFEITNDPKKMLSFAGAKFSYASKPLADELFFEQTSNLLLERTISPQVIAFERTLKNTFDIFAAAFYLVSRYEEYLPHEADKHGRFKAPDSVASRFSFLHQPVVDYFALDVRKQLLEKFPGERIETQSFKAINTIDVDLAYKYLHRNLFVSVGGLLRDLLNRNFADVFERLNVCLGRQTDPFQSFDFIEEQSSRSNIPLLFFWQVGDREGRYDKNTLHTIPEFQELIKRHADKSGIHLSYSSHAKPEFYKEEIKRLSEIIDESVQKNRFHYLKMKINKDYQKLINTGISEDYTMGYAKDEGFRASIARPFYWYDLAKDEATNLLVVPFMFMDTYFRDSNLLPDEIKARIEEMIVETKEVNGTLVALWHNNTFAETKWKEIFEWFNKRVND